MPVDYIAKDLCHFILLPIQRISQVELLFQQLLTDHTDLSHSLDPMFLQGTDTKVWWTWLIDICLELEELAEKAHQLLRAPSRTSVSSDDMSLLSEASPVIVLARTPKEPWEPVSD
jgi:hypothetical protein